MVWLGKHYKVVVGVLLFTNLATYTIKLQLVWVACCDRFSKWKRSCICGFVYFRKVIIMWPARGRCENAALKTLIIQIFNMNYGFALRTSSQKHKAITEAQKYPIIFNATCYNVATTLDVIQWKTNSKHVYQMLIIFLSGTPKCLCAVFQLNTVPVAQCVVLE